MSTEKVIELAALEKAFKENHAELTAFIKKASGEIEATGKVATETKAAFESLAAKGEEIGKRIDAIEARLNRKTSLHDPDDTLGARFIKSDIYKGMESSGRSRARLSVKQIVNANADTQQPLVQGMRVPGIITEPNRRLTVRDLLPVGRTTSNLIEYTREDVFSNNAGPQYEASPERREGITKPQSNITFTLQSAAVITLAHFIIVSRQVLSDAPMLQSYIDGRLTYGLKLEEEDEILNGDGTSGQLNGLRNQATAFDRGATGDTRIDTLRKVITQVQVSEYSLTGFVLNPEDWEAIELTKDSQERYIFANPLQLAGPTLWGRPVVPTNSMPVGNFLGGAFDMAAQLWDREDASVEVSREDSDNFRKNLVTVLAEERLALTVYRPAGFIKGTF